LEIFYSVYLLLVSDKVIYSTELVVVVVVVVVVDSAKEWKTKEGGITLSLRGSRNVSKQLLCLRLKSDPNANACGDFTKTGTHTCT
jgi:hypothetical protein